MMFARVSRHSWAVCVLASSAAAAPLGSGFTYQGQIRQNGSPVSGSVDLAFSLWDAVGTGDPPTGGNQIGATQTANGTSVTNGLVSLQLNAGSEFGAGAFNGEARWLQISVNGTTLAPRQALTAAPYGLYALSVPWTGITGVPAGFADGIDDAGSSFWQAATGGITFTGGKVGIGATTPSQLLHLTQATTPPLALRMDAGWASTATPLSLPTAAANIPDGGFNWNNVNNVLTQNNSGATAALEGPSALLQATGFNFAIPAGANIAGITVEIGRRSGGGGNVLDSQVTLVGGSGTSANKAKVLNWPVVYSPTTYGGLGDTWNLAWTPAQINSSGFGVRLKASTTGLGSADVDYIKVQVYYAATGSASWTLGADANADFCLAPTADLSNPIMRVSSFTGPLVGTPFPARVEVNGGASDSLRIRNATAGPWAIRIKNDAVVSEAGMLVSGSGQLYLTNRVDLASPSYAALNDSGSWGTASDRSLKRDIQPLIGLLERVRALRPVSYYLASQDRTREPAKNIGLIAQEVKPVFPSLVHGPEGSMTMDYACLSVAAVGAIQEQQRLIDSHRDQLAALRAEKDRQLAEKDRQLTAQRTRIDELENRLARVEQIVLLVSGAKR